MKYNVGEEARVRPKEWFENNCKKMEWFYFLEGVGYFLGEMLRFCGETVIIREVVADRYYIDIDSYYWEDWMLEDTVKKNIIKILREE